MSGQRRKKKPRKKQSTTQTKVEVLPIEIPGWLLAPLSLCILLSLISFAYTEGSGNWLGLAGYTIGWIFTALFGLGSYIVALYIGWLGLSRLFNREISHPNIKHVSVGLMVFSFCMLMTLLEKSFPELGSAMNKFFYTELWYKKLHFHLGGAPAFYLYQDMPRLNLNRVFNALGVAALFLSTFIASVMLLTETPLSHFFSILARCGHSIKSLFIKKPSELSEEGPGHESDPLRYVKLRIPGFQQTATTALGSNPQAGQELLAIKPDKNLLVRPSLSRKELKDVGPHHPFEGQDFPRKKKETVGTESIRETPREILLPPKLQAPRKKRDAALAAQAVYNGDFSGYKLPSNTLIANPQKVDQTLLKKDLRKQAEVLEETLLSFGIEAKVGQINCGPTITSFEVHPAIGVKVQKIKALENDIALNLEAKSLRILAPIPGKAAIGIEVPNAHPQEVGFKDMLNAYLQSGKKFFIPVLLGKTVNGDYVMEDLAKMPHIIIAGATGSGKSVCINTIVISILMTAKPDEIKLIMVDPKKVELTPYSKLPHMLSPVITEPNGACAALAWLVKEMESRYEILKVVGFRNIAAFNSRKIDKDFEESLGKEIPEKMHYIVCIIDELADLMMVSSNDIETYIARLAQMARAVGIHLILATQRPSREVITGLIKANFPTRLSFKVASRINSQIILDEVGAECLLGNGDMLFLPPGSHHLIRAQGAYIRDNCITQVVESICNQAPPNYVIKSFDTMDSLDYGFDADFESGPKDDLYVQAESIVKATGNASTTFLQRKLKIGYARAASIIDQLEECGVIGPAQGSKPREVLVKEESLDDL